jgi:Carboxypeptidase regulatory-like domain
MKNPYKLFVCSLILCAFMLHSEIGFAGDQTSATITGQICDQSGASIGHATVTLIRGEHTIQTTLTRSDGKYALTGVAAGRYRIHVEALGFASIDSSLVDVPSADSKLLNFTLVVKPIEERVEVNSDQPEALSIERAENADQTALSGKRLDALPDDPDDLQANLLALAGPVSGSDGPQFIVDGFTKSRLPPKHSIREVRINQDPFSAEHDHLGSGRIEVFTNPASSKLHGQAFFNIDDSALNSRNPYADNKPSARARRYGGNFTGPISQKLAYSVDLERRQINDAAVIHAWVLDSALDPVTFRRSVLAPSQRTSFSLRLDDQWSTKNSLTARYSWFDSQQDNAGIGRIALQSNAYSSRIGEHVFQVSNTSALSPRAVNELRAQYSKYNTRFTAGNLSPTVSVLDSFVGGGASIGPSHTSQNRFEILNYVSVSRRTQVIRFGARVRTILFSDTSSQNFNGNFIFAGGLAPRLNAQNGIVGNASGQPGLITISSLERYRRTLLFSQQGFSDAAVRQLGGGASQFLLSSGNPAANLVQADLALFAEDNWRVRPNLTLGFGLRYEVQNHLADWSDLAPRLSLAWALPSGSAKKRKVVLRFGTGLFYDRYSENLVLQTIRFNGATQHQFMINNPNFFPTVPALLALTAQTPIETIRQADARLRAPRIFEGSAGIEFQLPGKSVVSLTYRTTRGVHLLRSRNTTAPLPGVQSATLEPARPIGNVNTFAYESAGVLNQHQFLAKIESHFSPDFSIFAQYTYGQAFDNTNGPGWFPANQYDLSTEYGRSATDVRHRFFFSGTARAPFGLEVGPFVIVRSGLPFNITTGRDANGDSLFTDRPAMAIDLSKPGVIVTPFGALDPNPSPGQRVIPRNFGSGSPSFTVSLRVSREFSLGRLLVPGRAERPYKLRLSVSARNLLNTRNPGLPIGNLASPLFGFSNSIAYSSGPDRQGGNNRSFDFQALFTF